MERLTPKQHASLRKATHITPIAAAAIQAALANSFQPFRAPIKAIANQVGIIERPARITGYGITDGAIEAKGRPFHRAHPARVSSHNDVGFLQQIPQVYKDAARISSGGSLYL
jgi:hypothetical protein